MTSYVSVGSFDSNEGREGARGWRCWRKGKKVCLEHGGIIIERGRHVRYRWAHEPSTKGTGRKSTVAEAKAVRKNLADAKSKNARRGHPGYTRVAKILPARRRKR